MENPKETLRELLIQIKTSALIAWRASLTGYPERVHSALAHAETTHLAICELLVFFADTPAKNIIFISANKALAQAREAFVASLRQDAERKTAFRRKKLEILDNKSVGPKATPATAIQVVGKR